MDTFPTAREGSPTVPSGRASQNQRAGRAWERLTQARLTPEQEPSPAATLLFELADREARADSTARRKRSEAALLSRATIGLTLAALALAAAAGVTGLGDLTSSRGAGWIAVASAVTSAVSAFLQTKVDTLELRLEGLRWRHHADDVVQSVVTLIAALPMETVAFRAAAEESLQRARDGDPSRQDAGRR